MSHMPWTHSLSHLPFPSQFSQVGNPGASSSPGLRTDPITPSFTGSCPSDWGRFHQGGREAGQLKELPFRYALPIPSTHNTTHLLPPRHRPLALPLHTWNWTTHVPCLCPALLHAPPPQPESAKTHRASGISLETSSLPKGAWH